MSNSFDYRKYLPCIKQFLLDDAKKHRQKWATAMYKKYLRTEDWHRVRFSDEVHFCYKPKGQLQIIGRPSTYYCHDFIQHQPPPPSEEKHLKRKNCWAAIGCNFKLNIIFYNIPENKTGNSSTKSILILFWSRLLKIR